MSRLSARAPLPLRPGHFNQLRASGEQGTQFGELRVGRRFAFELRHLGEVGDHAGVDPVGLGQPTESAGELTGLPRVDDGHRRAGVRQCGDDDGFVTAGGLERDDLWLKRLQTRDRMFQTLGIRITTKGDGIGTNADFDPVFPT